MIKVQNMKHTVRDLPQGRVLGRCRLEYLPPLLALALRIDVDDDSSKDLSFELTFELSNATPTLQDLRLWLKSSCLGKSGKTQSIELEVDAEKIVVGGVTELQNWLVEIFSQDEIDRHVGREH